MNSRIMLVVLSFVLFTCIPSVQASEQVDQPDWQSIMEQAHNVQSKYSNKSVEYTTIRKDFRTVFTKEAMMSIFMEHILIHEELYRLASTDFSPYIIPSLNWTSFHVQESSKNEVILLEDHREPTELMGPQRILRKVTITQTEEGWRISHLDWVQKEESNKE
ncbi:DUF3993 domain-containing protein [Pontibacillus marinus]|uniref:DUF3993 domain-containing protein n=1 Tax=Pontibacillus marinus BH030004 = DSM 16465 TaxID=1385511 RepID=A0A0A5FX78_9BACI|nr:DUF3993 domain-containing protein [Pontibacillus marinus]KGX83350.1 hypothetical protein N783_19665 [Pontibacillus marinus BH030004 = DSM 16465]